MTETCVEMLELALNYQNEDNTSKHVRHWSSAWASENRLGKKNRYIGN